MTRPTEAPGAGTAGEEAFAEMALRSESILEDIAAMRIADDPRARRYMAALDAALDRVLRRCGRAPVWQHWLKTGDPRAVTQGAGYLAFSHAFPGGRRHRDPRLLAGFRALLEDVLACQRPTGELSCTGEAGVERPGPFPPHPGASHGQAWYLEPLLLGMNWLKGEFSRSERERIDAALYRTADFIAARPIHEMNNRGVIVCAVLALCGRYFGEERFLREAVRNFHGVPIQVFDERSGQVFEGSGPDGNYSGTSYEYLYMYRIMSGDEDIDQRMVNALKWYGRVMDRRGNQTFCGAATRVPVASSAGKVHDILPALERYSGDEPFFQRMIEMYLPALERQGLGADGHSVSPTIWALLEHKAAEPPAEEPAWYRDLRTWYHREQTGPEHFYYNEGYDSLYFPVRRDYTTCVALRGRPPFKDLQCWSLGDEPPVVYPGTHGEASRTRTWGIDTAAQNVGGVKVPDFCWVPGDTPGLIARWGNCGGTTCSASGQR